LKTDVTASTRFTSSSSHQTVGELVLCYYLLVAKQLNLIRFSRKKIIGTATNIKNKSEIKIDIKRKTKNITLPEQLKNLIDKAHKLRIPLTDIYKTSHFPGLVQALQ
jgi:hypothetical protein